jgi:hypothetical protein
VGRWEGASRTIETPGYYRRLEDYNYTPPRVFAGINQVYDSKPNYTLLLRSQLSNKLTVWSELRRFELYGKGHSRQQCARLHQPLYCESLHIALYVLEPNDASVLLCA